MLSVRTYRAVLGVIALTSPCLLFSTPALAAEPSTNATHPRWEVGAQLGVGAAWAATTEPRSSSGTSDGTSAGTNRDANPNIPSPAWSSSRFAYGGSALVDYYLSQLFAIEVEAGILNRGYRKDLSEEVGEVADHYLRVWYLTLPVGVRLDLHGFRVGVGVALEVGVAASYEFAGKDVDERSGRLSQPWDEIRRFNWGPRVGFGYAIPIGSLFVVPGASWSMHAANDMPEDKGLSTRYMNIMGNVGVFYPL